MSNSSNNQTTQTTQFKHNQTNQIAKQRKLNQHKTKYLKNK